jgi:hypothetical protein
VNYYLNEIIQPKSQRLKYYDFDKGITKKRRFNTIKADHISKIFTETKRILAENKLYVNRERISSGLCRGCKTHDDTYFVVEILSNMLQPDLIRQIENALAKYDCKLIRIVARQEKNQTRIVLVILQLPY